MDPFSIWAAIFIGGLFFKTQQDKCIEEDKKQQQSSKPVQQKRQPSNNNSNNKVITKCPHCGGNLNENE